MSFAVAISGVYRATRSFLIRSAITIWCTVATSTSHLAVPASFWLFSLLTTTRLPGSPGPLPTELTSTPGLRFANSGPNTFR